MNTVKILDVAPQPIPAQTPNPATPPRNPPQAVPALGDGATSDAIRQNNERQAEAAAAEAERKRAAAKPQQHSFDRKVGLVDDTFKVFVDLVSPALQSARFRIFGPPENRAPLPPVETNDPASAHAAYAGSAPTPPVLKKEA